MIDRKARISLLRSIPTHCSSFVRASEHGGMEGGKLATSARAHAQKEHAFGGAASLLGGIFFQCRPGLLPHSPQKKTERRAMMMDAWHVYNVCAPLAAWYKDVVRVCAGCIVSQLSATQNQPFSPTQAGHPNPRPTLSFPGSRQRASRARSWGLHFAAARGSCSHCCGQQRCSPPAASGPPSCCGHPCVRMRGGDSGRCCGSRLDGVAQVRVIRVLLSHTSGRGHCRSRLCGYFSPTLASRILHRGRSSSSRGRRDSRDPQQSSGGATAAAGGRHAAGGGGGGGGCWGAGGARRKREQGAVIFEGRADADAAARSGSPHFPLPLPLPQPSRKHMSRT